MLNDSPSQLQAWIARMNAGDNAAKNELLRYAYERLRGLARKMLRQDFPRLKNWEETDDVLQNAALRLDRALPWSFVKASESLSILVLGNCAQAALGP